MRVPLATYRLQLQPDFDFEDAAVVTDYLADLGVSHVYLSPHLQAAPGSTHGYDIVDPTRVNEELGGSDGHARLHDALARHGLECVVDIVPNHMSLSSRDNVWWWDVLRNGPLSPYARYFDIDWDPPEIKLQKRILLPVLADHYGRVLEAGELELAELDREVVVRYHDQLFPLSPETVPDSIEDHNRDPDLLDTLLEKQHYRLAYWKVGGRDIDYRRFFDIDTLVGVRVEDETVFRTTHALLLEWVEKGLVHGLRVDHPDGLRDPTEYLERLRNRAPSAWLIVEKILQGDEELRSHWPVNGTTGYEFLNRVSGVFIDPDGEKPMSEIYERFTGQTKNYSEVSCEKKHVVMREVLGSEVNRLTARLTTVCEKHRRYRDFTRHELHEAIREAIACLPVYRTYITPGTASISTEDERYVRNALSEAKERRPDLDADLFEFLSRIFTLQLEGQEEEEFILQFQQVTGSVMAKGAEDSAFYCYNRLIALNEVGGDPDQFGLPVGEFHRATETTGRAWPSTMLGTSTHDTKRSEDVRARIGLLSEIPDLWQEAVERWKGINERHRFRGLPSRNDEYLLYQTLVGAHPLDENRAVSFMTKAAREAKENTSWISPDEEYEKALEGFIRGSLGDSAFKSDLREWVRPLIEPGRIVSLAQTLIKLTAPGVPDFYQGCELWDLSLVDPDNRKLVDFDKRREILRRVMNSSFMEAWADQDSGTPKMWLIRQVLKLRREKPAVFNSAYEPLEAQGPHRDRIVAYKRGKSLAMIAPRWILRSGRDFNGTSMDLGRAKWRNLFTNRTYSGVVELSDLFELAPVGLLIDVDA